MIQGSSNIRFAVKIISIGVVLVVSFAASMFVRSVVDDRIQNQQAALQHAAGGTSQVLLHGAMPGFTQNGESAYRPVQRVLKYAILFIALTFLAFFLTEILCHLRLHPMQYLLVGLGLAEFYLLLLAFMEHMRFGLAYGIAATMTILLISLYSRFVLQSRKSSFLIGVLLSIIYTYLFVTLQLDYFALLAGALLLFVALFLVMFLTRNLNWYDAFDYAKKA